MEELNSKIMYYLNNQQEREQKAEKLYEFAKQNYDVEKHFPIEKLKMYLK